MSRETARTKADRLLIEGRVVILEAGRYGVVARVRGEGVIHTTRYGFGAWTCTCPARTDQCSHLIALRRVVAIDLQEKPR
ncbi:MAG: hypothetical protein ACLGI8_09525 [Acidimicrobiia bacterium]